MKKQNPIKRGLLLISLSAIVVMSSGCVAIAAAGAGAAGYAYVAGALRATVDGTVPQVQQATEKALDELGFSRIRASGDELVARVEYRTSQDEKVDVRIETASEGSSDIRIRVGRFGDENRSVRILEKIKSHL